MARPAPKSEIERKVLDAAAQARGEPPLAPASVPRPQRFATVVSDGAGQWCLLVGELIGREWRELRRGEPTGRRWAEDQLADEIHEQNQARANA